MPLPKRTLGSTGIDVSILGFGTVKLGRDQGVKYPHGFTLPTDTEAAALLAKAQELGINLLDTAPAYGCSEQRLGTLLKGQRQDWIICSKTGEEFEDGQSFFDFSAQHTRNTVERSLNRLKTDYLDIVLIHSNGNDLDIIHNSGALETLAQLKTEGKIRAFGMSTKTVEGGLEAARLSDCVMVTWNLSHEEEVPVVDFCQAHQKGVLIKKALASGHVTLDNQTNPVETSFKRLFNHPGVTSAIVGTINPRHLADNVQAAIKVTNG